MKQPISILPAIALRGTTILPDMIVHFDVSRERSIKAIEAAMLHDQKIFLVTQKDPEVEKPELSELYQVGTVAYINFSVWNRKSRFSKQRRHFLSRMERGIQSL